MPEASTPGKTIDMGMMYVIHDALRRDLDRFVTHVPAEAAGAPARWSALRDRWEYFDGILDHHHHGEDENVWPVMRTELAADPDGLKVLDAMEAEHVTLGPLVEQVRAGFRAAEPPSREVRAELAATIDRLRTALTDHLAHEERDAIPLIFKAMPVGKWEESENKHKNALGLRGAVRFFPWALDDASPERRAVVLGLLPAPLRLLVRGPWERSYRRRVNAAFG